MNHIIAIVAGLALCVGVYLIPMPEIPQADPSMQGRTMNLYGEPYTIIYAAYYPEAKKRCYHIAKTGISMSVWDGNPGIELQPTTLTTP